MQIQNELQLSQAFTRRSLACDLMGVITFRAQENWHKFLMDRLAESPPPNFRRISTEQVLRADRQAWQKLAEIVPSIKRTSAGALPLDAAFPTLPTEGSISFYLLPTRLQELDDKPPRKPWKGNGKGKDQKGDRGTKRDSEGKEKSTPELPDALKDMPLRTTSKGKRMCWSYNIKVDDRVMPPPLKEVTCDICRSDVERLFGLLPTEDALTAVHKDSKNGKFPNAALPITTFDQGQIWIENPEGKHLMQIDGETVAGELLPVHRKPVIFDAWRLSLQLLLGMLKQQPVVAVHLSPPIHAWHNSEAAATSTIKAAEAVVRACCEEGILWSISGPANLKLWPQHLLATLAELCAHQTSLDLCMFGAGWKLPTCVFHSYSRLSSLGVSCSENHSHCTRLEPKLVLPPLFCAAFVECLLKQLFDLGAQAPARCLPDQHISLSRAAALMVGKQPKGKRLKPLVAEFRNLVTLQGDPDVLPLGKLASQWEGCNHKLPAGTKCIRSVPTSGGGSQDLSAASISSVDRTYGIPWSPTEFRSEAFKQGHPKRLECGVPDPLKVVVDKIVSTSYADIAKDRTQAMRKWLLRACELKDLEPPFPTPDHCRDVLKNKSMPLFAEMLEAANYPDKDLVKTMCSGFDLLGQIPASGVLPEKHMDALLTIDEVRSLTPEVRSAILHQRDDGKDLEILTAVHKLTLEERDRGWLRGPLKSSEIPSDSVVTRRFGIKQSSTDVDKGKVTKIRPIDDYTQSLANLTCGSTETISPHGVDVICAGISY
ncbi:unnamed protein product, partial [Symbiodinium necroappetens]